MEINIKLMTKTAYLTLQKNCKDVYKEILKHPSDSTWLKEFAGSDIYETKNYVIVDFDLDYSENYNEVRFKNAVTIYEHLKDLPRYILCEPRFWAWITFEKAYRQSIAASGKLTESTIKSRWLISESRRGLMRGISSRNFFEVEVSIDNKRSNQYELTEYLFNSVDDIYNNILSRSIGMLKQVSLAYIRVHKDFETNNDYQIVGYDSRKLIKEASKLGSVMMIDTMSEDEIYSALYPKLNKIVQSKIEH